MSKKPSDESVSLHAGGAINAIAFLTSLDKEALAAAIAAKKAEFEKVQGELRTLMTLEKVRAIKDGERAFGPKGKRKKAQEAAEATGNTPLADGPADDDTTPEPATEQPSPVAKVRNAVILYYKGQQFKAPVRPEVIAKATKLPLDDIRAVLKADPDTFPATMSPVSRERVYSYVDR